MSFLKAIATVGGITLISRIAGFGRDVLMAIILGTGPMADAFFVALKLPNFFRRMTAEGAMSIAFIPVFSETLEKESKKKAEDYANQMLRFLFWIITPISILLIALMPFVIQLIAPGFDENTARYAMAVELSRLTFPYLLMMSLTALVGGMLNASGKYAPFAAAPIIFNLCLIVALLLHDDVASTPAHALAVAVSVSGILQLAWVWFFVKRCGYRLSLSLPKPDEKTRKTLKLMIPAIIGAGVMHINLFVDIMLASLLPAGAISYLYYADRLAQLPLGVIGIAIGTALLPMLSRSVAGNKAKLSAGLFTQAVKIGCVFSLPAAAAFLVVGYPVISTLFAHGSFTAENAQITAYVLMAYACGMPAYIASKTYATIFYANQNTKTPLIIASVSAGCNVLLSLFLIRYMGVIGIALATSCAGWVQLALLVMKARSFDMCRFSKTLAVDLLKVVMAAGVMAAVLYGGQIFIMDLFALGNDVSLSALPRVMNLSVLVISGLIIYGGLIMVLRVVTVRDIKGLMARK